MNTRRIFAFVSRGSLVALFASSLAPLGCVAATDGSVEDPGGEGDALTSDAYYTIEGIQSGKCVGVSSGSTTPAAGVDQATCDGSNQQQWRLHAIGDRTFQLTAKHSGQCLDVSYYSSDNGASVQQWPCTGSANESWKVIWTGDGEVELVAEHSGKCLDVKDFSRADGGTLQQWSCGDGPNQRFRLTPVGDAAKPPPPPPGTGSPLAGKTFYVDPNTAAAREEANARAANNITDADLLKKISSHAQGVWIGDWSGDPATAVSNVVNSAGNTVPILVAYNIPGRDCNYFSAGGAQDAAIYRNWIDGFAAGLGDHEAVVILEPDALWMTVANKCDAVKNNLDTLNYAVQSLKKHANTHVYIDAGEAGSPQQIAGGLKAAGVYKADGFALNTSDTYDDASSEARGHEMSDALGGNVRFVIDTSRNGRGRGKDQSISDPWCNPEGLGLGHVSTGITNLDRVDAFLWIKNPGESDGGCNRGNPNAGQWFQQRALEMAQNADF